MSMEAAKTGIQLSNVKQTFPRVHGLIKMFATIPPDLDNILTH